MSMLTRDIELEDAILDLLDNCIDGVIRNSKKSLDTKLPYRGHWARLTISPTKFEIEDNCGGIPRNLIERAFGIGRAFDPSEKHRTIGIYGIGMKRAIFKMALEAKVYSHSTFGFEVSIDEPWLNSEKNWRLPYRRVATPLQHGTKIVISKLRPEIGGIFSEEFFRSKLDAFISKHYAVILAKGFRVEINKIPVRPAPISLLSADVSETAGDHPTLVPYMASFENEKVKVKLWVGMYRKPDESDEESETEQRQSREESGWTVICNDRAVVSNDTTILTGWGEATVPRFHPQFIGIRGVVTMESDYPLQLPLTTTKRGLDASSILFLTIKEYMREGTKCFTSFTNHWKADRIRARKLFDDAKLLELPELIKLMQSVHLADVRKRTASNAINQTDRFPSRAT